MAERFGTQTHPSGGQRFGSQTYAALNGTAVGDLAATESGADVFAAQAQPSVNATVALVESGADTLAASGLSSLSHTMQAREAATPDQFIGTGYVIDASLRFGSQVHPGGGLRFGGQSWAALGPSGPMAAAESGTDTMAVTGWSAGNFYQFAIYDILASFVNYGSESLAAAVAGTLDDGYKVMLPVSAAGITIAWELNAFGNPSLRLADLDGASVMDDVPWYVWNGSAWTAASFDVSDAMQGAAFMVETGADVFVGNGANTRIGSMAATETGDDFIVSAGGVRVAGALAATETGADVFAAAGAPGYVGTMAAAEIAPDAMDAAGVVAIAGSLSATETGADTFAAGGVQSHAGDMAATETGADVFAAAGRLSSAGSMAATEAADADTFAGAGVITVRGALAGAETGADTFTSAGVSERAGSAALVEAGADAWAADGTVLVSGALAATELPDIFAAQGVREFAGELIAAELDALEGGSDRFAGLGINGSLPPVPDFDSAITLTSETTRYTVRSRKQAEAA